MRLRALLGAARCRPSPVPPPQPPSPPPAKPPTPPPPPPPRRPPPPLPCRRRLGTGCMIRSQSSMSRHIPVSTRAPRRRLCSEPGARPRPGPSPGGPGGGGAGGRARGAGRGARRRGGPEAALWPLLRPGVLRARPAPGGPFVCRGALGSGTWPGWGAGCASLWRARPQPRRAGEAATRGLGRALRRGVGGTGPVGHRALRGRHRRSDKMASAPH